MREGVFNQRSGGWDVGEVEMELGSSGREVLEGSKPATLGFFHLDGSRSSDTVVAKGKTTDTETKRINTAIFPLAV